MAYTLTTGTTGRNILTIADGAIDTTSTSLALPGRNYSGYGQPVDQDLIRLNEHYASSTQPSAVLTGQMWFNTTSYPGVMQICYDGSNINNPLWLYVQTTTSSGDLTVAGNLTVNGNSSLGPAANLRLTGGTPGQFLQTIDGLGNIQWSTVVIANAITFGNNGSTPLTGNIIYNGNTAGYVVSYNTVGAAKVAITVGGPNAVAHAAVGIDDGLGTRGLNPVTGNIYGNWQFTTGSSLQATYADIAERQHSDAEYPVGTVMKVGGANDVTGATDGDIDNVLGVVSTKYAYLLNSDAGMDATHPAIALIGRVPVRVVGSIEKHQKLIPTGNGCARASTTGQGFGWALESNNEDDEKMVLCVIK